MRFLDKPNRTSLTWEENNPHIYVWQLDPIFEELRKSTEELKSRLTNKDGSE